MSDPIDRLLELAQSLDAAHDIDGMLATLADGSRTLVDAPRANVRVLDESGTRLLVAARAGSSLHYGGDGRFAVGEGLVGWVAQHGVTLRLADGENDRRFVGRETMSAAMASFVGVPLIADSVCIGVLSATHPAMDYFTADHERIMALAAALSAPRVQVARLRRIARLDPLTGALNVRGLVEELTAIGPEPDARAMSVVLLDVDHFKDVNDRHGHAIGDQVLKVLVRIIGDLIRRDDRIARRGGDEFVITLPDATIDDARRIAQRACAALHDYRWIVESGSLTLSVSAGVAERRGGESTDQLLVRADTALYRAKQLGRNRVEMAG